MDKDKAIETLENNHNAFRRLVRCEKEDLDYRLKKTLSSDNPQAYEEIAKLCYRIARHLEQKEDFEFSVRVLKNTDAKYRGIKF